MIPDSRWVIINSDLMDDIWNTISLCESCLLRASFTDWISVHSFFMARYVSLENLMARLTSTLQKPTHRIDKTLSTLLRRTWSSAYGGWTCKMPPASIYYLPLRDTRNVTNWLRIGFDLLSSATLPGMSRIIDCRINITNIRINLQEFAPPPSCSIT